MDPNSFHSDYYLDDFVVGRSNEAAFDACRLALECPERPLTLIGGTGMGKTHLGQAVLNATLARNPDAKVRFVSWERFYNEMISCQRQGRIEEFRRLYMNLDAINIESIHCVSGKLALAREMLIVLSHLQAQRRLIVLDSCEAVDDLHLEPSFAAFVQPGVTIEVDPPDVEHRERIMRHKLERQQCRFPGDVVQFVAKTCWNPRSIEGAIRRIQAYSLMEGQQVNLALAKRVMAPLVD